MFIVGIFSWWYGAGWKSQVAKLRDRLAGLMDYFSIDLLLRTLFSPFRQISAGRVTGPIGVQFRAFLDQLVSRLIGAMVRSTIILIGVLALLSYVLIGLLTLALWALVPLAPIVGLALTLLGWIPWSN